MWRMREGLQRSARSGKDLRVLVALVTFALLVSIVPSGLVPVTARAEPTGPAGAPPVGNSPIELSGPVRVIDGHTFEAYIDGRRTGVVLIGIEVPPGNTACGKDAAALLDALTRTAFRLEEDPALLFDARGQRMYYVVLPDGRSAARELVKAGVARAKGEGTESSDLATDEDDAKAHRRGCLWQSFSE
jgi:endonuclease YncB( thermonuclease family)